MADRHVWYPADAAEANRLQSTSAAPEQVNGSLHGTRYGECNKVVSLKV